MERLTAWQGEHRSRRVTLHRPDAYGPACWEVRLRHEYGVTVAYEVAFSTYSEERGGHLAYRMTYEEVGVVFAGRHGDEQWPGLDATILVALEAFDEGVWEAKP
jgi:hypothetical protein